MIKKLLRTWARRILANEIEELKITARRRVVRRLSRYQRRIARRWLAPLAAVSPQSHADLKAALNFCESFDLLLEALALAATKNMSLPNAARIVTSDVTYTEGTTDDRTDG